ncbi:Vitamin K epoxide reductase family [Seminavis robusta]|uniref:Vitamin K epoxide reductase family n=1 Tax=Seminavis robusta TaxID=568900 RepID=A0A9N8E5X9_9STRA|nr:Vitamin K epoxide reductase family [Seminavis robusta]|eukprot:Sro695_g188760.1 Vitamin K epoxide reductase family (617) ;mRNA; r:39378-41228
MMMAPSSNNHWYYKLFLFLLSSHIPDCTVAWSLPKVVVPYKPILHIRQSIGEVQRAATYHHDHHHHPPPSHPPSQKQATWSFPNGQHVPQVIAATLVATALWMGNPVLAADEALLNELSKEDSILVESRSPPPIQAESSPQAMALAKKLQTLHAKMYGAYWCKFCAKQKELFGKQAFDNNNNKNAIEYVECSGDGENSQAKTLCKDKDIQGYPAWEINGRLYSGQRSLDEMEVMVRMAEASEPGNTKGSPRILTSSSKRAMDISQQLESLQGSLFGSYWDPHTFEQKERLGKEAFSKLSYVECAKDADNSQLDLCKEKHVQVVPTWQINGEMYPGDQDLDELEEIIASSSKKSNKATDASPALLASAETPTDVQSPPPPPAQQQSKAQEKPSPREISETSSNKALALAIQMQSLDTRMYGAYFCDHCYDQKQAFGKEAFSIIPYVECTKDGKDSQLGLCLEKGIRSVPTWQIAGKLYEGERSIDQLQKLVQAELEQSKTVQVAKTKDQQQQSGNAPPPIVAVSSARAFQVADEMEKVHAKLYGAYWCRYTQAQKERFGQEAFAKINYVECSEDGLNSASGVCREKGVDGYPTWEVNGKLYPGDQDLDELETLVQEQ